MLLAWARGPRERSSSLKIAESVKKSAYQTFVGRD